MQQEMYRSDGTAIPVVANPIKMSLTPPIPRRAPPALGADTEAELKSLLGLTDAQIDGLRAKGII
jgi:crotonobetainyl-CoA:carnitine CoA-transferase CaiB-like acyl-CoA transferase